MRSFEQLSISELNSQELLKQYKEEISNLKNSYYAKKVIEENYGLPLEQIYIKIFELEEQNRSLEYFPNDLIIMYPAKKEVHAKEQITCDFSGSIIKQGSLYINYRPLIRDLTTKTLYTLNKSLKVEDAYYYDLPENIHQLEELNQFTSLSTDYNNINYSHLNQVQGGEIKLKKLKGKRK